jgi:hypothetical protein
MVLTTFLHKLLYTFASIDRYFVYNPAGIEESMFANAFGFALYSNMICEYIFSLIILVFWIPNTYLFHLPWFYVKIVIFAIAALLTILVTKIVTTESYYNYVREHYFESKFITLKWHLLAHGLHVISLIIFGLLIVFL